LTNRDRLKNIYLLSQKKSKWIVKQALYFFSQPYFFKKNDQFKRWLENNYLFIIDLLDFIFDENSNSQEYSKNQDMIDYFLFEKRNLKEAVKLFKCTRYETELEHITSLHATREKIYRKYECGSRYCYYCRHKQEDKNIDRTNHIINYLKTKIRNNYNLYFLTITAKKEDDPLDTLRNVREIANHVIRENKTIIYAIKFLHPLGDKNDDNPHLHILFFGYYTPKEKITKQMLEFTNGRSKINYIEAVKNHNNKIITLRDIRNIRTANILKYLTNIIKYAAGIEKTNDRPLLKFFKTMYQFKFKHTISYKNIKIKWIQKYLKDELIKRLKKQGHFWEAATLIAVSYTHLRAHET